MSTPNALYIAGASVSEAESATVYTFTAAQTSEAANSIPSILKALYCENADNISGLSTILSEDITEQVSDGVLITNQFSVSDVIMTHHFKASTSITYPNSTANVIYSNAGNDFIDQYSLEPLDLATPGSTLEPTVRSNLISLDPDTHPIYRGHTLFKFKNGDSIYTSTNNHYLKFDENDTDYNLQKTINSTLSNLALGAQDGINVGFDDPFNSTNAFFTNNILSRSSTNQISPLGPKLGPDDISTSTGSSYNPSYNSLNTTIQDPDDAGTKVPLFGSLKFKQDDTIFDVITNDTDASSTISTIPDYTLTDTNSTTNSVPVPSSFTEADFKNLFSDSDFNKVGPGYKFELVVGNLPTDRGNYSLDQLDNSFGNPVYNDLNAVGSTVTTSIFSIDDSSLLENALYMKTMKENNLFDKHKIYLKNGTVEKNSEQSSNKNFEKFEILDGVESQSVLKESDINDLSTSGFIKVFNTTNTLGASYCRYTRDMSTHSDVNNSLVVSNEAIESDYLSDVGVLGDNLKNNYTVNSEITTLAKSTMTSDSLWTTDKDVAMAHDAVLVFKESPDSPYYDKSNISEFSAAGLKEEIKSDEFAIISIKKIYDQYSSASESPFFKTSDNSSIGVTSSIRLSDFNLNNILADDLRFGLTCKTKTNLPSIVKGQPYYNNWKWGIGNSSDYQLSYSGSTLIDGNNGYLISTKSSKQWLGSDIYTMMKSSPSVPLKVDIELLTSGIVENRDVIDKKAIVTLKLDGSLTEPIINKTIEVDASDLVFNVVTETTDSGVVQSIDGLTGLSGNNIEVKKFITTKTYEVGVRCLIGAYKNAWAVTPVTEKIIWYQATDKNQNRTLPDYYLTQIKDQFLVQKFKSESYFDYAGTQTTKNSVSMEFTVKDLMGFTAAVDYRNGSVWNRAELKLDPSYANSVDIMFDKPSIITFKIPDVNGTKIEGTMTVAVDSTISNVLGLSSHVGSLSYGNTTLTDIMYMIHLSSTTGKTSFEAIGYKYVTSSDSRYFNKDIVWDPYSTNPFLYNASVKAGTNMVLTTIVELIDPTPGNENEVNKVKVRVMMGDKDIASFVSNKWILEDFNIYKFGHSILQHDYVVSKAPSNTYLTEYLQSKPYPEGDNRYVKLLFGNNESGVRFQMKYYTVRGDASQFSLRGNYVQMKPINTLTESVNTYKGRYSDPLGEEILTTPGNAPLGTDSSYQRDIVCKIFRGLYNDQTPIEVKRTPSVIKLVIGNDVASSMYQDDMNPASVSNHAGIWKNRGLEGGPYGQLAALDIRKVTGSGPQPNDLTYIANDPSPSIGGIGLKLNSQFSMFPSSISSTKHTIKIDIASAKYTKKITNPLDTSIEKNVDSNVLDYVLHDFKSFDIIATRIKVYKAENIKFEYTIPDLKVYYSPKYIGDPATYTMNDWTSTPIKTYTDAQLRASVVVGDDNFQGVVKFQRMLTNVTSFTKYAILPRPVAWLEAYATTDFTGTLPADLSSLTRIKRYVDIDITRADFKQGLSPELQNHRPFNKSPSASVSNPYNALPASIGLNNVTLGFKIEKYIDTRIQITSNSFTLTSNKVEIYNGIGPADGSSINKKIIFNGYISELSDKTKWDSELKEQIVNEFTNKLWNLKFRQLHSVISGFITPSQVLLTNNYLMINGISSFGLGNYYLELFPADSIVTNYYTYNRQYNDVTNKVDVIFEKYITAEVQNWWSNSGFTKSETFRPLIIEKETFKLSVSVENKLTENRFNIEDLLKNQVNLNMPSIIPWTKDTSFVAEDCKVRISPLNIPASMFLNQIMYVNAHNPFRIIGFRRPPIILIKGKDGAVITFITQDGIIKCNKLITYEIVLNKATDITSSTQITPISNLAKEDFA